MMLLIELQEMSDFRVIIFRPLKFSVGWTLGGFYLNHVF